MKGESLRLGIARLVFEIEPPPGWRLVEDDPLYAPFRAPGEGDPEVVVRLTLEPAPDPSGLPVLFDTGEAWIAYREGDGFRFDMRGPGGDGLLWSARVAGSLDTVVVHCGGALVLSAGRRGKPGRLRNPVHYPLDQILATLCLGATGGLLLHAAGVARDGVAVVCAGVSGAGKTTLMRQWRGADRLTGLSDDRVMVRRTSGSPTGYTAFGTPWAGEGRVAEPRGFPLHALAFIEKSSRNELVPLDPGTALRRLLPAATILWYHEASLAAQLALAADLVRSVPVHALCCRPDPSAAGLLELLLG